jgi:aldehyde dehydrogenase (NAD+)
MTEHGLVERHKAAAEKFLPQVRLVIGSDEREQGSGGTFAHINPATGLVQAQIPLAGVREIDEAVTAARTALPDWAAMHPNDRRKLLSEFAARLRAAEWTELSVLENGQPWGQADRIAGVSGDWVDYYAGWADRLGAEVTADHERDGFVYTMAEPHGVVAMIITWNSPLLSLAMKLAPALAAGNTIVLKPAEFTAFSATLWVRIAREVGIPDGVINLVPGGPEAGEALVKHPGVDKISFTGGPATARSIMRDAADQLTPVLFELGGKGANLIFDDANLDEAIPFSCRYGLTNTGQACAIPTRMLVQRSVYAEVLERVEAVLPSLTIGDPLEPGHVGGALVNQAALDRVLGVIDRAKSENAGRLIAGGSRMGGEFANGYFVENTVFADVDPNSSLAQNEVFGPVLSIIPFDTEEDGIAIANGTAFGLSNYVQSQDLRRIRRVVRQLRCGSVGVNSSGCIHPTAPFGGTGVSGFGREGGREGIEEFVRRKTVLMR